ncbi:hypothetical protein AeRB84_019004 [Aphanomyces euteiches]|nr:hypothetical protein AeRB84_019004 [Aphanomyces euteiches]
MQSSLSSTPVMARTELSFDQRRGAYEMLLKAMVNGRLPYGAVSEVAERFQCHRTTISRLWSRARRSSLRGDLAADIASRKRGNSGARRHRTPQDIEESIKAVAQEDRQTLRTLAAHCKIPKSTIMRHMMEESRLKARSSHIKPLLTDANKMTRLRFALDFLRPGLHGTHFFKNMYSRVKRIIFVYDDDELALRSAKSKTFITKVMFLAAVAQQRYDTNTKQFFDGKLGIWLFLSYVPAARGSKNRPKGTVETVPRSVDSEAYKNMILRNVVPAIMSKFLAASLQRGVLIQQDNAGPHNNVKTELLRSEGFTQLAVTNQPAHCPDFNVLDLGIFNAIQSRQQQKSSRTIDELIIAVQQSFCELPMNTLAKSFLTLQGVMESSMEIHGCNNYKLPHMKKDTRG